MVEPKSQRSLPARKVSLLASAAAPYLVAAPIFVVALGSVGLAHAQSVTATGDVFPGGQTSPTWNTTSSVSIGSTSTGTLTIAGGGTAATTGFSGIGTGTNGIGTILVTGVGSSWDGGLGLSVGNSGNGTLRVEAGATSQADYAVVGEQGSGVGRVVVTGAGSIWSLDREVYVAQSGQGFVTVENGGKVVTHTISFIGRNGNGRGTVVITGNGSEWQAGPGVLVGNDGRGSLTLANGGKITATTLTIGSNASGTGFLNIGAAAGDAAAAAGTFNGTTVAFGNGTGTLVFNHTATAANEYGFGATITSPAGGSRTISHVAGVTNYTGNGTGFLGTTVVSGGLFKVNSTLGGTVSVTGGTLGGAGTVGSTTVGAGGTLAPGNSIGTITVNGNLTFTAGSTYAVELSPTGADLTNVTGTASLSGGTVSATFGAGTYANRRYTILTAAGGLGGTKFAGVTDNAPGVFTALSYDGNDVFLETHLLLSAIPGLNANQLAAAGAVDGYLEANGSVPGAFVTLDANGLTLAGGQTSTASVGAGMQAAGQFLDAMGGADAGGSASAGDASNAYAPLAYSAEPANLSSPGALAALGAEVPASSDAANAALAMSSAHAADPVDVAMAKRWGMWGTVYGSVGRIGGNAVVGSADLTARNWGIASGFERSFGNSRIGLSLGGAGSTFSLSGGLGSGSAGIFNAGIYGSHSFGNAYVSGALGYGWNNVRTTRNVPGDILTANFNAHTLAGRLETGYRFGSTSAVTPYVALQGGNYFLPAYTETSALNGPFALNYARQSEAFLRTELGARFEHSVPTSTGSLKFSARAAWAYNAINDRAVTAAFAALPGQTFTVNGARPARSAALLDLGMEANFDSGLSAKLNFNGEFSRNVSAYGASAKLIYRW